MPQANLYSILNRLRAIVGKSFPQYMRYSRPYIPPGKEAIREAFQGVVRDQDVLLERISRLLTEGHAPLRSGEFPMEYTDTHDLGIDYQLKAAIEYQQQDIASIRELIDELQLFPAAKALAEEALGMAKGHLDTLQELVQEDKLADPV